MVECSRRHHLGIFCNVWFRKQWKVSFEYGLLVLSSLLFTRNYMILSKVIYFIPTNKDPTTLDLFESFGHFKANKWFSKVFVYHSLNGPRAPQGGLSKSRFQAGFLYKSRPEIAWNSCSRQVYLITLNARLIYHTITKCFHPISVFTLWNMSN